MWCTASLLLLPQLLYFLSPHLFVAVHQLEHICSITGTIVAIRTNDRLAACVSLPRARTFELLEAAMYDQALFR